MKKIIYILSVMFLLANCKQELKHVSNVNSVLNTESIESSKFEVNCNADTILIGEKGTKITLKESTFIDKNGQTVTGAIELELKECITKSDIVLANLHTMSNGEILESGGMIYLNATQNGEQLAIANDKEIGVEVMADSSLIGMSYYEGEILDDSTINWKNPILIEPNVAQEVTETVRDSVKRSEIIGQFQRRSNIAYNIQEFKTKDWIKKAPKKLTDKIEKKIWDGVCIISKDSVAIIDGYQVNLYKEDTIQTWTEYKYRDIWVPSESVNTYMEDPSTNYLFSVKKLGWANIDRLYQDERTKKVEFITEVQDYVKFDKIFISMIFKEKNIYLPGYQRMDKTFGFSHGDFEDMNLPIGETVQILATSTQDGECFYSLESVIIEETTLVNLTMKSVSKENLKQELLTRL